MDIDEYFRTRADLTRRLLLEGPADRLLHPDRRFFVAGLLCIVVSTLAVLWSSAAQSDAGFFARTTTFLGLVLMAGVWLLTIAQAAHVSLTRTAIKSRDAIREKTLARVLRVDGGVAQQALQRDE